MSAPEPPVVARMHAVVGQWEEAQDPRAIFLSCCAMMTRNRLVAVQQDEFRDAAWVDVLLHRFADYYFVALGAQSTQSRTWSWSRRCDRWRWWTG